jgi:Flp pilus assembly protein TadD
VSAAGSSRSPEAQACLDRGLAELAAGNGNTAIALLRRATQLAPGDSEVQDAFSRVSFRDRNPNRR